MSQNTYGKHREFEFTNYYFLYDVEEDVSDAFKRFLTALQMCMTSIDLRPSVYLELSTKLKEVSEILVDKFKSIQHHLSRVHGFDTPGSQNTNGVNNIIVQPEILLNHVIEDDSLYPLVTSCIVNRFEYLKLINE